MAANHKLKHKAAMFKVGDVMVFILYKQNTPGAVSTTLQRLLIHAGDYLCTCIPNPATHGHTAAGVATAMRYQKVFLLFLCNKAPESNVGINQTSRKALYR